MRTNDRIDAAQAAALLARQLEAWPLAGKNYKALEAVRIKTFDMGGFTIRAQFNPARIVSTGAKVDTRSLRERKCFLCPENLPAEQERPPFGPRHLVLCNPYPIFPLHLTLPTRAHTPQRILPQWEDFLEITKSLTPLTLFYNGPRCGASAPDHAHFQAVSRGIMPLDEEIADFIGHPYASVSGIPIRAYRASLYERIGYPYTGVSDTPIKTRTDPEGRLLLLTGNLRPGFVIQAASAEAATRLFRTVYDALPIPPGEDEPMMNLFGSYYDRNWVITLIPRKRHRPWQYEAEGDDHLLSSPGAADIGGLFITPLEKDFGKINPELLRDVYQQVCLSDREVAEIYVHLPFN